jgi:amino acid transporter
MAGSGAVSRPPRSTAAFAHGRPRGLGTWSLVAIGIGGMVGGGIFAVLGLAVELSGGATPLAFAVAGAVALATASSYAGLSARFPSRGGTVVFLNRAFGRGATAGSLNVLLWLSYVVMLALYASAFGAYGARFLPAGARPVGQHLLASGILLALTLLNFASADIVGRAERWVVGIKIAILLVFIGAGVFAIHPGRLAVSTWPGPLTLVGGGMVIFVAYEGFELIANAAEDARNPVRSLPRAYFVSVGFVVALYVLIALVTVGSLAPADVARQADYALAAAARPTLGSPGFVMIGVAALLSTTSAINATLYGSARLSWAIARSGELPEQLIKKAWNRPVEGLLITAAASLVLVNVFDVNRISTMGSAGFLIVFGAVNLAAWRLTPRRWLGAIGAAGCLAALLALGWLTLQQAPADLVVLGVLVGSAVLLEVGYRLATGRELRLDTEPAGADGTGARAPGALEKARRSPGRENG